MPYIIRRFKKRKYRKEIEVERKEHHLKQEKQYQEAKIFLQTELVKIDDTIQKINSKLDEIEKVKGYKTMNKEEFYFVKELYNNIIFEYYGYVEDEGININHWGEFREMKQLKEIRDNINDFLSKESAHYACIILWQQMKPRIQEVESGDFKVKSLVISAVKDAIGKREGQQRYLLDFKWDKYYEKFNITKKDENTYSSHGKVERNGIEHDFNIDLQINNGEPSINSYSFE